MSDLEEHLLWMIRAVELPEPVREVRFHPIRKWRVDFMWEKEKIIAEVEGATYARGRHTRGAGFEKDAEKYNAATLMGYRVFRFTRSMIESGQAVATLERAFE